MADTLAINDPRLNLLAPPSPWNPDAVAAPALASAITPPQVQAPPIGVPIGKVIAPPTQTQTDTSERSRLINTGSGVSQIHNPLLRGIARAADIAGSVFLPGLAAAIPGTTLHHNILVNQASRNVATDQAGDKANVDLQDSQAQVQQRQALAAQETAKAATLGDPRKAVDPSKTVTTDDGVFQLNPETGHYDTRVGDAVAKPLSIEQQAYDFAIKNGKNPVDALGAVYGAKNTKDAGLPQQYLDAISSGDTVKAGLIKKVINDTSTQPKIEVHAAEAGSGSAGTWQMVMDKDGNPKFFNNKTGEIKDNVAGITKGKGDRATVDEQKRADLAKNMNENLNAMEDILSRRPELFGPIAGRLTDAKAGLGTDDPDIAKMINIKHQLGMVAQGTHGMRSAQGIESAANSLLGGFHNSPAATKAALESARTSAATFLDDANKPGQSRGEGIVPSGLAVSLKDAMSLDRNKGKSEADVRKDIEAHGHAVKP
jgi:hypothetical protein